MQKIALYFIPQPLEREVFDLPHPLTGEVHLFRNLP